MADTTERVRYEFEVVTDSAIKELTDFSDVFESVGSGFKRLGTMTNSLSKSIKASTKVFTGFTKAAKAFTGVAIGKGFAEATKEAIDFYETLNLFRVAMKDSIDVGNEFIDHISEWYGLDPKNLMQYTGTFYEMAYAVSMPDEAARTLSTSLTALSVDLASLFNTDVETVTDNLTSGLRGASRAVVKYGLDLRATTVEAFANERGITEQYETMNEASREILRYATAITQAKDAMNDFNRTIKQPANQLRVFKEQITQLGRAIGTFVVKPLKEALPIINGFVMALHTVLTTMAEMLGLSLMEEYESGFDGANESLEGIGKSADEAAKKVRRFIAPFDELNVMQSDNGDDDALGFGEVDPALLQLLDEMQYSLQEVQMKATVVRNHLMLLFGFTLVDDSWVFSPALFGENLAAALPGWRSAIEAFFGYEPSTESWVNTPMTFQQRLSAALPTWQQTIAALFNLDTEALLGNVRLLFYEFKVIAGEAIFGVITDLGELFGIEITDTSLAEWFETLNQKFINLRVWIWENKEEIADWLTKFIELVGLLVIAAPLVTALGDAFFALGSIMMLTSGFVNTVSGLFGGMSNAVGLLTPLFDTLGNVLSTVFGASAFALITLFVLGFVDAVKEMWTNSETFRNNFSVMWENVLGLIGEIVDFVKNVLGAVKQLIEPYVKWISTIIQGLLTPLQGVINSVIDIVRGLFEILNGIFTGDGKKVLTGFLRIFVGLINGLASLLAGAVNLVLGVIKGTIDAVGNMIYSVIKGIIDTVNFFAEFVGHSFDYPSKSSFQTKGAWRIDVPLISLDAALATGGVVTGPTRALIGEAGRSEAVIPLDDSPQMRTLVQRIADAVENNNSKNPQPMEVRVYLDSREITSTQNRTNRMYGRTQQNF